MKLETLHDFRESLGSSEDQANLGKTHAISSRHAFDAKKPRTFQILLKMLELSVDSRRGFSDLLVRLVLSAKNGGEKRSVALVAVMFAFRNQLPDPRMLLRGSSEERWFGVQFIQITQNGDRLRQDEVTVLEHRNTASRVECQKVRGLVLLFGRLKVPDVEGYALRDKPEHHPPW